MGGCLLIFVSSDSQVYSCPLVLSIHDITQYSRKQKWKNSNSQSPPPATSQKHPPSPVAAENR